MENACVYCGKIIEISGKWKNKTFCSNKCKREYKMSEIKKREKRKMVDLPPSSAFDQLYW